MVGLGSLSLVLMVFSSGLPARGHFGKLGLGLGSPGLCWYLYALSGALFWWNYSAGGDSVAPDGSPPVMSASPRLLRGLDVRGVFPLFQWRERAR